MKEVFRYLLYQVLRLVPSNWMKNLLGFTATQYARSRSADEGLRFLFGLDAKLYIVQGELAVAYDGGIHTKHRHMRYHDFFVGNILPTDRVLDVGCGIGAVAFSVAESVGAEVVGIDLNENNIAIAKQRYSHPQISYIIGDALKELPDGHFNVVVLSNVLEHLPDRSKFLEKLLEKTKAQKLLIRVPLFERDWRVPLKKELGVEWRLDDTHTTEYTIESFSDEIAAAGLRIENQEVRWGEIWGIVQPEDAT